MNKMITLAILVAGFGTYHTVQAGGDAAAGKIIVEQQCQACHGVDGNSPNTQYPKLGGQHGDYIIRALKDYKSGARKNAIMSGFAGGLSEKDQKDIAAWYSTQNASLVTPEVTQ